MPYFKNVYILWTLNTTDNSGIVKQTSTGKHQLMLDNAGTISDVAQALASALDLSRHVAATIKVESDGYQLLHNHQLALLSPLLFKATIDVSPDDRQSQEDTSEPQTKKRKLSYAQLSTDSSISNASEGRIAAVDAAGMGHVPVIEVPVGCISGPASCYLCEGCEGSIGHAIACGSVTDQIRCDSITFTLHQEARAYVVMPRGQYFGGPPIDSIYALPTNLTNMVDVKSVKTVSVRYISSAGLQRNFRLPRLERVSNDKRKAKARVAMSDVLPFFLDVLRAFTGAHKITLENARLDDRTGQFFATCFPQVVLVNCKLHAPGASDANDEDDTNDDEEDQQV